MKKQAQFRALEFIYDYWTNKNSKANLSDFAVDKVIFSGGIYGKKFFGFDALKDMREMYQDAFPEAKAQCLEIEESESVSCSSWKITAVHLGEYQLFDNGDKSIIIDPRKKLLCYNVELILFFKEKKIYKFIAQVDIESFLHQIGIFKRKESYNGQGEIFNSKTLIMNRLKEILNPLLTERECECLSLNLRGLSSKQSALILCVSNRTIETHLSHGFAKLDCFNKYQCFEMMYENNSLPIWLDLSSIIIEESGSRLISNLKV